MSGDIQVDMNRSFIYVREYTLKPLLELAVAPVCTRNHSVPGFLFSNAGFSGNL